MSGLLPENSGPSLIVAMSSRNRAIGRQGTLPWHAPEDLAYFRTVTMGHVVILGSRTWESIGHALSGRTLLVVSRRELGLPEGTLLAHDPPSALELALSLDPSPVVGGGAAIYDALLPHVRRLFVTEIDVEVDDADTFFAELDLSEWTEVKTWKGNDARLTFRVLDRVSESG